MMRSVMIRGVSYASQKQAAQHLNVSPAHITQARKAGRLETVGLKVAGLMKNNGGKRAMPVTIDGVRYPSRSAAIFGTGLHYRKLVAVIEAESRCGR